METIVVFNLRGETIVLQIKNLKKVIGKREVLSNITIDFEEGNIYPILGTGNTLMFQCIAGDLKYEQGDIVMEKKGAMLDYQQDYLPVNLTGYQFMELVCENSKHQNKQVQDMVNDIFKTVNLKPEIQNTLIKHYSKLELKKLQIAQFLAQEPYIMMFEYPIDHCDPEFTKEIMKIMKKIKEKHIILFSTGILDTAKKLSNQIMLMQDGELELYNKEQLRSSRIRKHILTSLGDEGHE